MLPCPGLCLSFHSICINQTSTIFRTLIQRVPIIKQKLTQSQPIVSLDSCSSLPKKQLWATLPPQHWLLFPIHTGVIGLLFQIACVSYSLPTNLLLFKGLSTFLLTPQKLQVFPVQRHPPALFAELIGFLLLSFFPDSFP